MKKLTHDQHIQIESSETTRETLLTQFDFQNYIQFGTPQHRPKPNHSFLEWFIGFFESEGVFLKPDDKNRVFGIEISYKDPQLMYKIRTTLGFGKVNQRTQKKNEHGWCYFVQDVKNVIRLFWLFNGNFVTQQKQSQFQHWWNDLKKTHPFKENVDTNCRKISLKTAWLSGFFEGQLRFWADPNNLVLYDTTRYYNIHLKFYLVQQNEFELLNQMKQILQIPNTISQKTVDSHVTYFWLETGQLKNHSLLINYLTTYPFLGKRTITFQRWKRVYGYSVNDYPITDKSIKKLQRLILTLDEKPCF